MKTKDDKLRASLLETVAMIVYFVDPIKDGRAEHYQYIQKRTDQLLSLIKEECDKAVEELADNIKSIEYPPSGKEWHFNDGTWTNSLDRIVNKRLEKKL